MQRLSVLFVASWWSFWAGGLGERGGGGIRCGGLRFNSWIPRRDGVGARREARGKGDRAKPQARSRPGGSILCFLLRLIFYVSFRLSSLSQARQEAPAGRSHFRAGLWREHRVTPLMKGRDGLASLQGRRLSPDQRQQDGVGMLPPNKCVNK